MAKKKSSRKKEGPKTPTQQVLHDFAEGVRTLNCNADFEYCCFYDLVERRGQHYEPQKRPKRYRKGIPQHCFVNSAMLVFEHPRSLVYVEGYVLPLKTIALPIHHAWCAHVRDLGKAIDVTLDDAAGYFGIPFEMQYLVEQWDLEEGEEERISASLIDNVEDGFPLLRMSAEELAAVIYKGKKP
jgi:hypothetical protein